MTAISLDNIRFYEPLSGPSAQKMPLSRSVAASNADVAVPISGQKNQSVGAQPHNEEAPTSDIQMGSPRAEMTDALPDKLTAYAERADQQDGENMSGKLCSPAYPSRSYKCRALDRY